MRAMEKQDLESMTIPKLREEALKYPDRIEAAHEMKKEELVSALCDRDLVVRRP